MGECAVKLLLGIKLRKVSGNKLLKDNSKGFGVECDLPIIRETLIMGT